MAKKQEIILRLQKVARQRSVPFNRIATEYLIECLVRRLTASEDLANKAVFKGGYVALRVYNSPRYTTDLDLSIRNISIDSAIAKARTLIEQDTGNDGVWFKCQNIMDLTAQGEYGGKRIVAKGGIGNPRASISKSQTFHVDIGIGDAVVPEARNELTPSLIGQEDFRWRVYSVETLVSEKLHALITRGSDNSRSRDIFDIYLLLDLCEAGQLYDSLMATFRSRGDALPASIIEVIVGIDNSLLKRGWSKVVATTEIDLGFDEAFRGVTEKLRILFESE